MAKKGEYTISLNGTQICVTKEVFEVYTNTARRMRYYEYDLKVGRLIKKDGKEMLMPSKEDSYDRLEEAGSAPGTSEDVVIGALIEKQQKQCLYEALRELGENEFAILFEIYWNGKSERELSLQTGVPQKTINDRKRRILAKLKQKLKDM